MDKIKALLMSDIPFARDDAHRLLPAMIACLVGFAALLTALAISLSGSVEAKARDVAGLMQVEAPRSLKADAVEALTAQLRKTPGVRQAKLLADSEMEALLKPWLGNDFTIGDVPVPLIFDVKTDVADGKSVVDAKSFAAELQKIDRGIRVVDQGPWVGQMARATHLLQGLVLLVAGLLLACVVGMIVLVARTNLKLHFKAVSLLHMFGATDEYILRQFQWNNAWLAVRGAAVGVLFALLIFGGWVVLSHRWQSPIIPEVTFGFGHAIAFLMLPVLTALIALAATRLTVQSMLRHMH